MRKVRPSTEVSSVRRKFSHVRTKATCGQSPLVQSVRPFFDVDVNVGLLVEPVVVRLPFLVGICEADVEGPDDLRNQLINLAQRDLRDTLAYMRKSQQKSALTFLPMQVRGPAPN